MQSLGWEPAGVLIIGNQYGERRTYTWDRILNSNQRRRSRGLESVAMAESCDNEGRAQHVGIDFAFVVVSNFTFHCNVGAHWLVCDTWFDCA